MRPDLAELIVLVADFNTGDINGSRIDTKLPLHWNITQIGSTASIKI